MTPAISGALSYASPEPWLKLSPEPIVHGAPRSQPQPCSGHMTLAIRKAQSHGLSGTLPQGLQAGPPHDRSGAHPQGLQATLPQASQERCLRGCKQCCRMGLPRNYASGPSSVPALQRSLECCRGRSRKPCPGLPPACPPRLRQQGRPGPQGASPRPDENPRRRRPRGA
jgi:hypothetical protein